MNQFLAKTRKQNTFFRNHLSCTLESPVAMHFCGRDFLCLKPDMVNCATLLSPLKLIIYYIRRDKS